MTTRKKAKYPFRTRSTGKMVYDILDGTAPEPAMTFLVKHDIDSHSPIARLDATEKTKRQDRKFFFKTEADRNYFLLFYSKYYEAV